MKFVVQFLAINRAKICFNLCIILGISLLCDFDNYANIYVYGQGVNKFIAKIKCHDDVFLFVFV